MAENKVVIKINYDKDKIRRPAEPKMVTVWHTRRILAAIAILTLLVGIPIFWFGGDDGQDLDKLEQTETAKNEQPLNNGEAVIQGSDGAVSADQPVRLAPENAKQSVKNGMAIDGTKRPVAIIYTKKVVRASLNSGLKDKEPYQPVKLPIRLGQNQKIELFYFTELKNMKDGVLYHYWSKDGQMVEKKQLNIKDSGAKLLSGRTLSYKDKGEWQIQLVDKKDKVFSEVNFLVNPE
ncbi:MAG: DUF2914 domain-containing protein [Methylococcaceae bacterium]|nr:DUF2914 domain-containing protein [Methylococcaceae bacterium]